MLTIGPYRFTNHDALRTVENFPALWAQLGAGRDASALDPLVPDLDGDVADVLPRIWAAMLAAGPALRTAGQLPDRTTGTVARLNVGSGGVPKAATTQVTVGFAGIDGDVQASRKHHGRPWQALCLWSTEVIDAFNDDGHRLVAGAAGENITLSGLPWAEVRPGVRLRLGDVVCEVAAYALPCKQNARWFVDGKFRVMHHELGPVSRVYATVLQPGSVCQGDAALLEP